MAAAPNTQNPRPRPGEPGVRAFAALAPYISFADHLSLRLSCRAWRYFCRRVGRPSPPFPWLMLPQPASPGPALATARRSFYDIPRGRAYAYEVPGEDYHRCVASAHGWLILEAVDPRRLVLVNPITGMRRVVAWPFGERYVGCFHAVLTSSPLDRACFLVVATDRLVAYCRRPGTGERWLTLRTPGFRYDAAASDIVSVGAMVYLVDDRKKLWRADLADPEPKVERRNTAFALPLAERTRHHLVESLRHVLLVLADEHHRRVTLYRLDWERRMWVPANGWLGDRVLLLGRGCSASVPASAAPGRSPGTVLFAHQPSNSIDVSVIGGCGGGHAWFWAESRVGAGPDDLLVLKKTVPHRQGEFAAGDSFWFFPAIDPDENA